MKNILMVVNQFKPGDTVKLKISNQQMTVRSVSEIIDKRPSKIKSYECVWYDNAKLQRAFYTEDVLEWLAPDHDILHFANYE